MLFVKKDFTAIILWILWETVVFNVEIPVVLDLLSELPVLLHLACYEKSWQFSDFVLEFQTSFLSKENYDCFIIISINQVLLLSYRMKSEICGFTEPYQSLSLLSWEHKLLFYLLYNTKSVIFIHKGKAHDTFSQCLKAHSQQGYNII